MQNSLSSPRKHVVVCAFPFGGHAPTLLLLVQRMAAVATNVDFTFVNSDSSNIAIFNSVNVPNIIPCALPEFLPTSKISHMEALERFLEAAPVSLRRGIAAAEAKVGAEISSVVGDAFLWYCGEIAKEKGVAWIPVWTSGLNSLSCHIHTDVLRSKFRVVKGACIDNKIGNCVPGFSNIRFRDIPSGIIVGNLESPFSQMLYKMGQMLPKATAVAINSFEELEPIITNDLKSKMKLLNVGPFFLISHPQLEYNDQYGCISWMDKQKAQYIAYISFGTFLTPPQEEILALAEALMDVKVPFIWSMSNTIKMQLSSSFLQWISDNEMFGKIVPWAPQKKILTHPKLGVFITHCGWNSVLESIASCVPLVCRSIIGDQFLNQQLVEHELKMGVGIEGGVFTKDNVIKALHQVLSSEVGEQMRQRAKVLKEVAEGATQASGSSNKNFSALMELVTSPRETLLRE